MLYTVVRYDAPTTRFGSTPKTECRLNAETLFRLNAETLFRLNAETERVYDRLSGIHHFGSRSGRTSWSYAVRVRGSSLEDERSLGCRRCVGVTRDCIAAGNVHTSQRLVSGR
jgi:hypothetical protein